ncbi:hypothetical protein B0H16DRAFT_1732476 [Mycena metata]|uniref:Uncharacterized protein n=1 Tax=Mycena metata TaxID=1033252 RepID=A0AAD7I1Y5_9AGAR|nr:hypothetical protein B0H16DRAFT_1732476 [Mycena metata]
MVSRAGELRRVGTGLRRGSGGIDEREEREGRGFEGESVDKECISATYTDGDGARGDAMCRRARTSVMPRWRIHLPPPTIPHIANYTPNYTPNLNLKNAPMPAVRTEKAKAAKTNGEIPLRRSRRKEDSTIADATKPRKHSNPEQAGTVGEDSTIADATKPRTRLNTKATTVPAAPKPSRNPLDAKGAGDEEECKRATATATEDPAPRPLPRPRTPDAQADTADTQPEAPSLDSASADPFSMRRRGPLEYQPPLVPPGLIGLRFDLTGEEDPSLDVDSTPAVVCVKREPNIDGLEINLAGEENFLEENPFASGSPCAQSAGPHSHVPSPDQTRPPSRSHTVDTPQHSPAATPPQPPAPPAPPAPAPAPTAPAPQPAPAPEPAHPTPAPAPLLLLRLRLTHPRILHLPLAPTAPAPPPSQATAMTTTRGRRRRRR